MTAATLPFIQTKPKSPEPQPQYPKAPFPQAVRTCLAYFSPIPIYIILLAIQAGDPVCSKHNIPFWIIAGIVGISEVFMANLIYPEKVTCSKSNKVQKDFEEDNGMPRKMSMTKLLHGLVTVITLVVLWLPMNTIIWTLFPRNSISDKLIAAGSLGVVMFSGMMVLASLTERTWMAKCDDATARYSIYAHLIVIFITFLGIKLNFDLFTFTIGFCVFLGCNLHLRFVYFYSYPPKNGCLLTMKGWRAFLKVSFGWILLAICMIFCGVHLFFIMEYASPDDLCLERTASALFVFIGGVPTAFVLMTIVKNISDIMKARN